jgi:hypothetical protein
MGTPGIVTFEAAGDSAEPSPSVWSSCPKGELNEKGQGYFAHEDFLAPPTGTLAAALDVTMISFNGLALSADTDTVLSAKAAERGGYLDIETDADDNDAAALYSEPFGQIVEDSGNELWFEARLEVGDIAGDQGIFVGLVEEAGASLDVVADGAAALVGESLVGFVSLTADPDAFAACYKLNAGTRVDVLTDVTNATAIATADRASLVNDTEVKLGVYFNGRDGVEYFVNGIKVATFTLDATFPTGVDLCAIVAIKTGTTAAESIAIDWVRYGARERT